MLSSPQTLGSKSASQRLTTWSGASAMGKYMDISILSSEEARVVSSDASLCLCLGLRKSPKEMDTGWDCSCVKYEVPTSSLGYASGTHSATFPGPMLPRMKKSLWKTKTRTTLMSDHNYWGLCSPLSSESSQNSIRILGQRTYLLASRGDQGPRDPLLAAR